MHNLQPKHTKLQDTDIKKLLDKYNISRSQLPKIRSDDPALPEGSQPGDVIQIDRVIGGKVVPYFRVVVP